MTNVSLITETKMIETQVVKSVKLEVSPAIASLIKTMLYDVACQSQNDSSEDIYSLYDQLQNLVTEGSIPLVTLDDGLWTILKRK